VADNIATIRPARLGAFAPREEDGRMDPERLALSAMESAVVAARHVGKHFAVRWRLARVRKETADLIAVEDVETGERWRMERSAFEAWAGAEGVALGNPVVRAPPLSRCRHRRAAGSA
jgi:hypothetical protein